jgi:hypothetical protein
VSGPATIGGVDLGCLRDERLERLRTQMRLHDLEVLRGPGMVLVVELYAGEVGGDHGVKLGDEVLVTEDGLEILAPYPFDASLLG